VIPIQRRLSRSPRFAPLQQLSARQMTLSDKRLLSAGKCNLTLTTYDHDHEDELPLPDAAH
jgi:hypothetical protein